MGNLANLAASMIGHWAPLLARGEFTLHPQDDSMAVHAPKLSREESQIQPESNATDAYNLFRAFAPAPGTFVATSQGPVRLHQVRPSEQTGEPGVVLSVRPELTVSLKVGSLTLLEVQPEGRRRMSGTDFANGARLAVGQRWLIPGQ
jgi:methionyl-tRNA formyltransferase